MLQPTTEQLPQSSAIDLLSPAASVDVMLAGHHAALDAVKVALPEIVIGAGEMAGAVQAGNALIYIAAGSSGLMALADACELPGTFGISADMIQIHMAGGVPINGLMPGDTEDDVFAAEQATKDIKRGDVVIVLSASGTTPFAVTAAKSAKAKGGVVLAIANNPSTALLDLADIAICLQTPPEAIGGSTRLGAGTAQKAALNIMSSLMGIELGHVYHGQMVNVVADNAKLVRRAEGIVQHITGISKQAAVDALKQTEGDTKTAILVASGCSIDAARTLLSAHAGHLGRCFQALKTDQNLIV